MCLPQPPENATATCLAALIAGFYALMPAYPDYRHLFSAERASASIRVLRGHEAPLVLCFLQENFKAGSYAPTLSNDKLVGQLADFLETHNLSGDGDEGDLGGLGLSWAERATRLVKE
jgi:hypothetical protein